MSDISIRIQSNQKRVEYLEKNFVSKKQLTKIHDWMFKPVGVDLNKYYPDKVCFRLREFENEVATLVEIETIKTDIGYQDKKKIVGEGEVDELKKKAELLGYEIWGEMNVNSIEYKISIDEMKVTVLSQKIDPIGEFIKIESESDKALIKLMKIFEVSKEEKIERNAAVLLGEKLNLIK